jgi:hypothetical protein
VAAFVVRFRLYERKEIMLSKNLLPKRQEIHMKHIGTTALLLHWRSALATALCAAACCQPSWSQVAPSSILKIDLADFVVYSQDSGDPLKYATEPNVTPNVPVRNFYRGTQLADIVAVNGQHVKGTFCIAAVTVIASRIAPAPGQAIADIERSTVSVVTLEILKSDGTPIGTIVANGLHNGIATPGSPLSAAQQNLAISGGTGAFLGVRGQLAAEAGQPGVPIARLASMAEDPANRRRNGGGRVRWVAHLIPLLAPQIVTRASGPAVFHSDFSPVTAANPARAGEVLIAEVTGLGPTVPGVDPGRPFSTDSRVQVNSPVDVTVNGSPAEVINAIGWLGLVDTYRIDFRVPGGTTSGIASIQITAAWIAGPVVRIPVQ